MPLKAQAATHPSYEAYGYDAAGNQSVAVDADNRTTTTQYGVGNCHAPDYGMNAAYSIWDTRAIVIRDFESLSAALHYLRTGHLPPGHE